MIINTDKALDILCNLTPIFGDLINDAKSDESMLGKLKKAQDNPSEIAFAVAPMLKKESKYRNAIYEVLAICYDSDIEKVKNQSLATTINQVKELIKDNDLNRFFTSSDITAKSK